MIRKLFNKAETGKLIVSGIMLCVEPTTAAATLLSLDTAIEARNKLFKDYPDLDALATELDKTFTKNLKEMTSPSDAQAVLPDMLKAAFADPDTFVKHDLDAKKILATLMRRFDGQPAGADCRRQDVQGAFQTLFEPLLKQACRDDRLRKALDFPLWQDKRKEQRKIAANVKRVMEHVEDASNQQLREAADFFADAPGAGATPFELMTFIKSKAEEIQELSQRGETLPDAPPRLANVKAQIAGLIDGLRLDDAEDLLDGARDILKQENLRPILEQNAELDTEKAHILILRGEIDAAFDLLSQIGDSFATVDPLEPARRRLVFEDLLYAHGLRYGCLGIERSAAMLENVIEATPADSRLL